MKEFVRRTWLWLVGVYARSFHRGIGTTPLRRWEESAARRLPRPPRSKDDLNVLLTRVEYCKISNTGVTWGHLRWNGDVLKRIRTRPGFKEGTPVKVRIDDQDVSRAWVTDPATGTPEPLAPVDPEYMRGLTLYQHRMVLLLAEERFEGARDDQTRRECRRMLDEQAQELTGRGAKKSRKGMNAVARHRGVGSRALRAPTLR
ncbi:hypothetical protein [Dankookia sp. P2]|uniref:hypothetical protein n=1 Tax=Dankookia sp. P2 TaxID=3423955 RepID=UPI003D66F535